MGIDVEVRHLRVLLAVVDAGGFSAASSRLHVAQSSLSRTVAELERRLGVQLLTRTTRRVETTPEGQGVVRLARHTVEEVDRALAHLGGYLDGSRGSVSIAALPSSAACLLPPVIAEFRRQRPEVSLRLIDALAQQTEEMVDDGSVDFAVSSAPSRSGRLASRRIATDRFYALCRMDDPWCERESVTWADVDGRDFVHFTAASSIRTLVDATASRIGLTYGTVTEASSVVSVAGLVAAGAGVTVVPALVGPLTMFAGIKLVELLEPVVTRDIWIIHDPLRPMSPSAKGLLDVIHRAQEHSLSLPPGCAWSRE